ncbi:hypothetical protein SMQC13_20420 [Serratia marcescens]|nr:hypothetical protein SMQC13_20420 [Serratia marcescens]
MTEHGVALRSRLDFAVGHGLCQLGQALLFITNGGDCRFSKFDVDAYAAVVDLLIAVPQRQLSALIVPARQFGVDGAHGVDIEAGVFNEALPLHRVRFGRCAAQLAVLRPRLAKQLDQLLAGLIFGLIGVDVEHFAQRTQRAREAERQRFYHRIAPALNAARNDPRELPLQSVAQHGAVEMAVVRVDQHALIAECSEQLRRQMLVFGEIVHADRAVIDCPGEQHDLDAFRIGMGAVLNRGFAEGFEVEPEFLHQRMAPWFKK